MQKCFRVHFGMSHKRTFVGNWIHISLGILEIGLFIEIAIIGIIAAIRIAFFLRHCGCFLSQTGVEKFYHFFTASCMEGETWYNDFAGWDFDWRVGNFQQNLLRACIKVQWKVLKF